ncbi:MAG: sulfotransferase [Gemmatimonadota bacterium]
MQLHAGPPADARTAQPVFVVGSPRSGTTWLQLLLAQHPGVATSQETHLFLSYLGRPMRRWDQEAAARDERRKVGLTAVIGRDEFLAACRAFADTVFDSILAGSPSATHVLEKTPDHAVWGPEILAVYPEAAFVHVVRDPRDVVCSMRSAGRSWGRHWAPTNVLDGVRLWRSRVEGGLEIGRLTSRYHQVHYEELKADAAAVLGRVCDFLELPTPDGFCMGGAHSERVAAGGVRRRPPHVGAGLRAGLGPIRPAAGPCRSP